jgi:hypothetical protein
MSGAKSLTGQSRNAGWALVNVHSNYLCCDGAIARTREYPIKGYKSSLGYVTRRYNRAFQNKTPRGIAQFWASAVNDPAVEEA